MKVFASVTGLLTLFMVLSVGLSTVRIVPAGNVGIVFNNFSGVEKRTLDPGLHLVIPFVQSVNTLDCRTHNLTLKNEEAVSLDQQHVWTDITVNYSPDPSQAGMLYQTVGFNYEDKIVAPVVREALKAETAKVQVDELLAKRDSISQVVRDEIKKKLEERGLNMELVSLTNLKFSDEYRQAIERKQVALQDAEAMKNKLTQAKIEADITKTKAQAEADRIKMINSAMSENPAYLQLEAIQKINPEAQVIYVPQSSTQLLIPQLHK